MCAAGVPIFESLSREELYELGQSMNHKRYRKGQVIALAGDPVEYLMIVARGRLNLVHTSSSGREQVVRTVGPHESLGELALFTHSVFEGDLVCAEDADVCLLYRNSVLELMARNQNVALKLAEALARRLSRAESLIADLGLKDVGQRLAKEIMSLAQSGKPADEGIEVTVPLAWAEIAARIGTTPETLSRRLNAFADQGLIRLTGPRSLIVLRPLKLQAIAEQ
jgi:CRP-like cAMP-binding protein